jgi:uncharacterized protein YigA (DUF484 family)
MKCIYLGFVTAILFLLACNSNKSPESEQTPLTDNANDKEELLAVLHKWTNGYLTHDTAVVNSVQAEEWVRDQGFKFVSLSVFRNNTRAMNLYKKFGYNEDTIKFIKKLD